MLGVREGSEEMMGWMPRAKRIGESGSPCWTPVLERTVPLVWMRRAGVECVKWNQGDRWGMEVERDDRMVCLEMELKALERSTWRRRWLEFCGLEAIWRRRESVSGGASLTPTPVWRGNRC